MTFPSQKDYLHRRILIKPFIYKRESLGIESIKIIFLLFIQFCMLLATKSYNAAIVVLSSTAASFLADLTVSKIFNQKQYFSVVVSIVQGMLIGMLVPCVYSPVSVFFCVYISMLLCKYVFGGYAYTWINPVIFSVIVLWFSGSSLFPGFSVTKDILMMRNPSLQLIENGTFPTGAYDLGITDFLNSTVFGLFRVTVPQGYISMFWDTQSIIPGFRFNFITIVSSLVLFSSDLYKVIIPSIFTIVYLLLVRFVSPLFTGSVSMQGDMLLALLSSGTIFIGTFVLGRYATVPVTVRGKIVYGVIAGFLAFLVAGCGTSSIGLAFVVLISDICSLFIQWIEDFFDKKGLAKVIASNNLNEGVSGDA